MKKVLILLASVMLMFSCAACNEDIPNDECTAHVDLNSDGKCDECAAEMEKFPCTECKDGNGDGKCDACDKEIEMTPCTECKDENTDGKCDRCGGDVEVFKELKLIENKKVNFSIVHSDSLNGTQMMKMNSLVTKLKSLGCTVEVLDSSEDQITNYEVLIGNIDTRGEQYMLDPHQFGYKGYAVKMVEDKIVIVYGSDDTFEEALNAFTEQGLGITDSTKKLTNVTFTRENEVEVVQDDYKITSLTVNGTKLDSSYVIAYDKTSKENKALASTVQNTIYRYYGKWLETVEYTGNEDKCIAIITEQKSGGEGFYTRIEGNKLIIASEFPNKTVEEGKAYFDRKLIVGRGDIAFDATVKNVRDVNYEMFGAIGDGVENDVEAIRACHEYANTYGHTVSLGLNKKYIIKELTKSIFITTDVDFKDATFIIDDREIKFNDPSRGINFIQVLSDVNAKAMGTTNPYIQAINDAGGIDAETCTKLDLGLGYPALLKVVNSNHKTFIRYGANQNSGQDQVEMILIDADGNIDPDTPFIQDYTEVTQIYYKPSDETPITIKGGKFITRANQADADGAYYARNIHVKRSNTTLVGLVHQITDERLGKYEGDPYSAFFSVDYANNVLFDSLTVQAHRTYYKLGADGKTEVGMGTYDINSSDSNKITWKNCIQSNFFDASGSLNNGYWGVMGSGTSKNLTFDGSTLSRFDAHQGLYNAKIIDSVVSNIRIVGSGDFIVENSTIHSSQNYNTIVELREDYGSFWHGNIIIKDVLFLNRTVSGSDVSIMNGQWYNHDFGYPTAFATTITVDNLTLGTPGKVHIFRDKYLEYTYDAMKDEIKQEAEDGTITYVKNINKCPPPERITVKNNKAGLEFIFPDKPTYPFFKNTEYVIED